jgi:hypothetical protein
VVVEVDVQVEVAAVVVVVVHEAVQSIHLRFCQCVCVCVCVCACVSLWARNAPSFDEEEPQSHDEHVGQRSWVHSSLGSSSGGGRHDTHRSQIKWACCGALHVEMDVRAYVG